MYRAWAFACMLLYGSNYSLVLKTVFFAESKLFTQIEHCTQIKQMA